MAKTQSEMSQDTKTIIAVILLVTVYPIGVIYMWVATKWAKWVKLLATVPVILIPLLILPAIALIAINPAKQFSQANDTKRSSDINAIAGAVASYSAENGNTLPEGITSTPTEISSTGVNICEDISPQYIAALPTDPLKSTKGAPITDCKSNYSTGYNISVGSDGRVTVTAPMTEIATTEISVTR